MQKVRIALPEIKLVGLKTRTNNQDELDQSSGKIFPYVHKYFHDNIAAKISQRKKPGTTFCVYMDYESDHTGNYTYFIGEEVAAFDCVSAGLEKCIIQPQVYTHYTSKCNAGI